MLRKAGILAALGLLSVATGASAQGGETMYLVHMYTDETHSEEVGYLTPQCKYAPGLGGYYVQYTLHGTYTYYTYDEPVGYCGPEDPL